MLHKSLFKKYVLISALFVASAGIGFFLLFFLFHSFQLQQKKATVVKKQEKPLAYVQSNLGYFAISKEGEVLYKKRSDEIPEPSIIFYQTLYHTQYQAGQKIGFGAIQRALIFILLLQDLGYRVERVAIDSVDMIACKTKGFEVVFSQTRPIDIQTHEVRQIVRQMKVGALYFRRLDVRFDKPVVQLLEK